MALVIEKELPAEHLAGRRIVYGERETLSRGSTAIHLQQVIHRTGLERELSVGGERAFGRLGSLLHEHRHGGLHHLAVEVGSQYGDIGRTPGLRHQHQHRAVLLKGRPYNLAGWSGYRSVHRRPQSWDR